MTLPTVFMFSGQGSQYFNMGRPLFERQATFRQWMHELDEIVIACGGPSIVEAIYKNKQDRSGSFDNTLVTHPAIFALELSLAKTLIASGIEPKCVLGSSLGELAAAVIANVFSIEHAVELVVRQADIFDRQCPAGGMIAIMAPLELWQEIQQMHTTCEIASVNGHTHFVISGALNELAHIENLLSRKDINFQRLPVTRGFHSSQINQAEQDFKRLLQKYKPQKPALEFISCTTGEVVSDVDENYFWNVVRKPMNLIKTFDTLESKGHYHFIDVGPSGTMANFAKRCFTATSQSKASYLLTPFDNTAKVFDQVVAQLNTATSINKQKNNMNKVYMFPGQGSQHKGMGKDLFDQFPDLTRVADDILGYSIKTLCLEDPEGNLNKTQFTQPALFVVNALSYLHKVSNGNLPSYAIGHSLGEFNALFAAGAFDFETGLKLVKRRGELMGEVSGGGMAAVLNLAAERIAEILKENGITSIDFANFNLPNQTVIAGPSKDLAVANDLLEKAGAACIILKVSAPFHSRYMQTVKESFGAYLQKFKFNNLQFPVIANFDAQPYDNSNIISKLERQVASSVRWTESVWRLMRMGITDFEEIGPGNVLTNISTKLKRAEIPSEMSASGIQTQAITIPSVSVSITAENLGSKAFKHKYGLKHAYMAGAMYKGIASKELVVEMARAGYLAFFGSGGLKDSVVEEGILHIREKLTAHQNFGMNLVCNLANPSKERALVELFMKHGVDVIEAAAFMQITPALVLYRLRGLKRTTDGKVVATHRIIAKVSRPEVAQQFLEPAPRSLVDKLLGEDLITPEQAEMAKLIPMADDLCVEADSGGHTDMGVAFVLLPTILRQRDAVCKQFGYASQVGVGAAGGIGTPEAAAAAFILGADFIVTGSINQCSVEAGTSDIVKDMLSEVNIQDTDYSACGDMFEIGAKVQVLKRGVFFPARANKLYELWRSNTSLEDIDEKTRQQIQEKYFKRSFEQVYDETRAYYAKVAPHEIDRAERDPKHKMALIFKWYFIHSTRLAMNGDTNQRVDYQVHCGPALGAFNQWVKGTELENWRNRRVAKIADKLMTATAAYLNNWLLLSKASQHSTT